MSAKNGTKPEYLAGSKGTINLSPSNEEQTSIIHLTNNVHHLPCFIKFTGPTDVSHYFKPKSSGVQVDGLEVEEAYFRGRKLHGVSVPLPDWYSGFILGKRNASNNEAKKNSERGEAPRSDDGSDNNWEVLAKCGNMTFWNHDSLPSQDDACLRLFHWFAVSRVLHEPLSTEDLNSVSLTEVQKS